MPGAEIELNPVDFITIGTVGPKGKRVFYLQAGHEGQIASMIIEKEQSWALSEAINEFWTTWTNALTGKPTMILRNWICPCESRLNRFSG